MPRKATAAKTAKKAEPKTEKPKSVKSKSVKSKSKSEKSVKVVEPEVSDVEVPVEDSSTEKKKRRVPTKETIVADFDELVSVVQGEIDRLRESSGRQKGVKFLRSLNKRIKVLRGHSVRVMKQKTKTNRKNNTNSGFLKPVQLSKEMAKFTGWDHSELRSRVDVTKYICNYIRENNLQNPDDRRQIVADKKLANLLQYDSKSDDKPLTYYRIQTYMKKHFVNPEK
jgi:chromatin remodeling complex protein RSC6